MVDGLFVITIVELFIGGGGRLVQFGSVTLRMILFGLCMIVSFTTIFFRMRSLDGQRLALGIVLVYLLIHVFALLVGELNEAEPADMLTEFQQSLYWLAAPFFALALQRSVMVYRVAFILKLVGVFLSVAYLIVLAMLAFGRLSILQVLPLLHDSGEVIVRGDNFLFYKGFLYLGISIIFFVATRGRWWFFMTTLVLVALVLTLTRGFLISTAIAVLLLLVAQGRRLPATIAIVCAAFAAFVVFVYVPSKNQSVMEQRTYSNSQRQEDMRGIIDDMTSTSLLIGQGYGALVNDRQNIENSLLWAEWKLGLVGLAFWTMPILLCGYYYLKVPNRRENNVAGAFFFGTVLIYVETLTNPYLNNPIGLSYIIIALFSLRTLSRERQSPAADGVGGLMVATDPRRSMSSG